MSMQINILSLSSEVTVVQCSNSDKVFDVKKKIREAQGIPENLQRLLFDTEILDDNGLLKDFGLTEGSTLTLLKLADPWILMEVDGGKFIGLEEGWEQDETHTFAVRDSPGWWELEVDVRADYGFQLVRSSDLEIRIVPALVNEPGIPQSGLLWKHDHAGKNHDPIIDVPTKCWQGSVATTFFLSHPGRYTIFFNPRLCLLRVERCGVHCA